MITVEMLSDDIKSKSTYELLEVVADLATKLQEGLAHVKRLNDENERLREWQKQAVVFLQAEANP